MAVLLFEEQGKGNNTSEGHLSLSNRLWYSDQLLKWEKLSSEVSLCQHPKQGKYFAVSGSDL